LQRQLQDPTQPWDPWNTSTPNSYLPLSDPSLPGPGLTSGHDGPLYVDTRSIKIGTSMVGLLESRRGYEAVDLAGELDPQRTDQLLALDPNVPTFFANPFRSPDAGNLVPLPQLQRRGVDCGLIRSNMVPKLTQAGGQLISDPKLAGKEISPSNQGLLVGQSTEAYRDANRNTFFRYQPLTRLANMATTRSNVFAVWVTIGFFEVEESPDRDTFKNSNDPSNALTQDQLIDLYNRVYPDGYMFGKEAGSEMGDTRRLRGFAIIDRTIPVAFEPGQEHNSRKAVRLRRRIE
jgi:hypothetical protein